MIGNRSDVKKPVNNFEDLEVYQKLSQLHLDVHEFTMTFPKFEMYELGSQLRRSSNSAPANIAEGWAKRRYPAHFTSKLTDADAELQETLHWLMRAKAYGYIDSKSFDELWNAAKQVGRRLGSMLKSGDWS